MQKQSRVLEDPLVQRAMQIYHAIDDDTLPIARRLLMAVKVAKEVGVEPEPETPKAEPVPTRGAKVGRRRPTAAWVTYWGKVAPHVKQFNNLNCAAAADKLNEQGVPTMKGKRWHASTVWNFRHRMGWLSQ